MNTLDNEQMLIDVDLRSESDRKSALLRPLNNTLIGLTGLTLVFMIIIRSNLLEFIIIGLGLAINLLVAFLDRNERTNIAVHLFCHSINLLLLCFVYINVLVERNIQIGLLFACVLCMAVMLAGMLTDSRGAFLVAFIDIVAAAGLFGLFFSGENTISTFGDTPLPDYLNIVFPLGVFLLIVAVISWLYQRALGISDQRLRVAQQRIMRDELLRRDLAVARELQQRLYPPPPMTSTGLSIASRSEPARETSGDFYDFIELGNDRLGIVVADVTGKSIAAALVMAMTRSTLRSEATRHTSPADVLRYANRTLCSDRSVKQMITACYGILDTRSMRLHISNAGHPFPIIRRGDTLEEVEICGLPLGALAEAGYEEQTIQLEPGDQLVIISDGIIEERNESRELFGFDRMFSIIAQADLHSPQKVLNQIWEAVTDFRGSLEQSDDITLVVVQVGKAA